MYRDLRPLDRSPEALRRIDLRLGRPPINPVALSIGPIEAPALAPRFPLAWRRVSDGWDLVALTGLAPDHDYWRADDPAQAGPLPLLARAYPLAVQDDGAADALNVLVDAAAVAPESDDVEPWSDERASVAAAEIERRCQALWTFVQSRRTARRLFADLPPDAFAPWDLALPATPRPVEIRGLHVLAPHFYGGAEHRDLVARHGWRAASLVALHRMSLHRVRDLLADYVGAGRTGGPAACERASA